MKTPCSRLLLLPLLLLLVPGLPSTTHAAAAVEVATPAELRLALSRLQPGGTIKIRPGEFGSGYSLQNLQATEAAPVVIEAADPAQPPLFSGGGVAWHLQGCAHVTLRNLHLRGQKGNGLNIDDAGSPAHHLRLENLHVEDIGPTGNCDGIKLSGVEDFTVRNCRLHGWGGQGIDMVGCHRGLVEHCRFEGKAGFSQANAVQAKGGSEDIRIRLCTFHNAGQRGVNLGGSTGRPYFRPKDAPYEARRILVEGCLFVGGLAPVAFVGVEDGVVRFNTFVNPEMWALRILQENQEPGMAACAGGVFANNLIAVTAGALRTWVNVGPGTRPESFKFTGNWWYHHGTAAPARPNLPAPETNGHYGTDPRLDPAANYQPLEPAAAQAGRLTLPE